jgi:Rap1a immunity proteins
MKTLIAAVLAVIALSIPASAGCHIVAFNTLVCDPNISALRGLIPNVQVRMGPPPVFPAAPPIVEAHYLMEACSSPDKIRQAGCAGFVSGVADSYAYTGQYCLPSDKAAVEQSVIEYITRIPLQGLSATNMVLEALRTQWPCGRRR